MYRWDSDIYTQRRNKSDHISCDYRFDVWDRRNGGVLKQVRRSMELTDKREDLNKGDLIRLRGDERIMQLNSIYKVVDDNKIEYWAELIKQDRNDPNKLCFTCEPACDLVKVEETTYKIGDTYVIKAQ